ncbi:MAG: aminotransferase class I/II-fold pyridoxal phosphate-dependent enzyme [Lentisphaerota bacterium]
MDGDVAPLKALIEVAQRYKCRIMVDEAHGTGVLGAHGRGAAEAQGVHDQVDLILGTFSKTFGATGGFVTGKKQVVDYIRHYGRSYIFTASPAPSVIAGVRAALQILIDEPGLRETLWKNIRHFHKDMTALGLSVRPPAPESAILSVIVGPDAALRPVARAVFEKGLFVGSAAYPAVTKNASRLRFGLSALHTRPQLDQACRIMKELCREYPILLQNSREEGAAT